MNSEHVEWLKLFEQPQRRRCWLLWKALECSPLDRAIDLARAADEFLASAQSESGIADASVHPKPASNSPQPNEEQPREETSYSAPLATPAPEKPTSQKRMRLSLSPEKREQLSQRLAQGARNAELASEFGLSKQQVPGIRMGLARQIAQRRHTVGEQEPGSQPVPSLSASTDEIVRDLRHQDDVVVPQERGQFLVN